LRLNCLGKDRSLVALDSSYRAEREQALSPPGFTVRLLTRIDAVQRPVYSELKSSR
jgi:hypothetical protein